jgi:YidC/Oxa1 family membrane protein insertase
MFVVTANIFQPLIDVFEAVLKFFHNSLGVQWGWSIVLLTIVVRLLLLPLTLKQYHSMQRMQAHMPELKAIQNKYKDDKQRQQQEMMKFYKENNINPFGSCLPLVAQLPVFISLFYMLRQSLRPDICPQSQPHHFVNGHWVVNTAHTVPCGPHNGASFLFIPDLTNKATGIELIVLIVLYVGTQLASSLMMTSTTMDKTQRNLMLVLPLVFVVIIINFPAGLLVYWITTNLWTIGQQYIVRKRIGPMGPPVTASGPSDGGPRGGGGSGGGGGGPGRGGGPGGGDVDGGANGAGGGLSGLLRGRPKPAEEPAAVGGGSRPRTTPPPPPPRKRKKRSGRRR